MKGPSYSEHLRNQADLMRRMMERLNVDLTSAMAVDGGLAWYEAQTKCIFCPSVRHCSDWLAASPIRPGGNQFCPNAGFFAHCLGGVRSSRCIVPAN